MWFNELSVPYFSILFNFHELEITELSALAFVVDDTGSMGDEINAVKDLITAIVKAERDNPVFYILGTFNDPGTARHSHVHYVLQFATWLAIATKLFVKTNLVLSSTQLRSYVATLVINTKVVAYVV